MSQENHFLLVHVNKLQFLVYGFMRQLDPGAPTDVMVLAVKFARDGTQFSDFVSALRQKAFQKYRDGGLRTRDWITLRNLHLGVQESTLDALSESNYANTVQQVKGVGKIRCCLLGNYSIYQCHILQKMN
eukprot:233186_1